MRIKDLTESSGYSLRGSFTSPKDIVKKFPVRVLYQGSKHLQDPETEHNRFMVIGVK